MFKRFQALKQAYKTITSTQPKTTKGLPQAIKTITSTKPKTTKEGKKKIELLKKLGKDQKKIGIDKYKDMGGNKLANEVLNVDKKAKGGRIGFKEGTGKSGVPAMDIKSTPTKKLSEKQKKIARLAGDPRKIDKPDFAKLRNRNKKVI